MLPLWAHEDDPNTVLETAGDKEPPWEALLVRSSLSKKPPFFWQRPAAFNKDLEILSFENREV